jgi:ribosomal protein S18 acetylase RimI-like enzyme
LAKFTDFCCDIEMQIEAYTSHHLEAIVRISLQAWAPVFEVSQSILGADGYQALYPYEWSVRQRKSVEDACAAQDTNVWVAIDEGSTVGFVALKLHSEDSTGEICLIAVDLDFQGRGIGTALIEFALTQMKDAGMSYAGIPVGTELCWDAYRDI